MYGLYRAWFGSGVPSTGYPCLEDTFSPPDTVVRVGNEGEHQFVAHKGVLAAHSGYLKALLANATTTTTTTSSSTMANSPYDPSCATISVTTTNGQSPRPVTSVLVSSIGGEAFAPLLNYMYTGRLEVTLDNVYSVLLATHLLHMPGALEQCRAALLRLRAPPPLPTPPLPPPVPTSVSTTTGSSPGSVGNILRPIPNRLVVGPPLCWPPTTPLAYPPTAPAPTMSHLPPSMQPLMQPTVPPGINVVSTREKQEQCAHFSSEISRSPQSSPPPQHKRRRPSASRSRTPEIVSGVSTLPFVAAAAAAFTAFAVTNSAKSSTTKTSSPTRSISPALSSVSRTRSPVHHHNNSKKSTDHEIAPRSERKADDRSARSCNDQQRKSRTAAASPTSDDGPSRGNSSTNNDNNNEDTAISEHDRAARLSRRRARNSNAKETSSSSAVFSVVYDIACCDGPVRFHRVLNENYSSAPTRQQRNCQLPPESEDPPTENDENGGPATRGNLTRSPSNDSSNDGSNSNSSGCYTCGYCKHTFKSQYCYRKHAKRHLLPTRINEVAGGGGANHGPRQDTSARGNRREVRLLDLNVQYYPCKICGCKFPSYYFVHKHRKMCHANDEERQSVGDATTNASSRDADASSTQDAP